MDWLIEAIEREATPKHLRQETADEFSYRHNIDVKHYYYVVNKEENRKKSLELALDNAKIRAPAILEKLGEMAEGGNIQAINSYLDYILKLSKNLDLTTGGKPIIQIAKEIADKHGITSSPSNDS